MVIVAGDRHHIWCVPESLDVHDDGGRHPRGFGLTGLGGASFDSSPGRITISFTNGIAILIASTQIKDFLGLTIENVPSEFAK